MCCLNWPAQQQLPQWASTFLLSSSCSFASFSTICGQKTHTWTIPFPLSVMTTQGTPHYTLLKATARLSHVGLIDLTGACSLQIKGPHSQPHLCRTLATRLAWAADPGCGLPQSPTGTVVRVFCSVPSRFDSAVHAGDTFPHHSTLQFGDCWFKGLHFPSLSVCIWKMSQNLSPTSLVFFYTCWQC